MLSKIIKDFVILPWQRKVQIFILVIAVYFFAGEYRNVYLEQQTPSAVINEFINIPLPENKNYQITLLNHRKMSVFGIKLKVEDKNKQYMNIINNYLKNNNCKKDSKYNNKYINDKFVIYINQTDSYIILKLSTIIRGEFYVEKDHK